MGYLVHGFYALISYSNSIIMFVILFFFCVHYWNEIQIMKEWKRSFPNWIPLFYFLEWKTMKENIEKKKKRKERIFFLLPFYQVTHTHTFRLYSTIYFDYDSFPLPNNESIFTEIYSNFALIFSSHTRIYIDFDSFSLSNKEFTFTETLFNYKILNFDFNSYFKLIN